MPAESVVFSYDGVDTYTATITGAQAGHEYVFSAYSQSTLLGQAADTAAADPFLLTVTGTPGTPGEPLELEVFDFAGDGSYLGRTLVLYGAAGEFGFAADWVYDGDKTVTATVDNSVDGLDYIVGDDNGAFGDPVTGTGGVIAPFIVFADTQTQDYFSCFLYKDSVWESVRLFTGGAAGAGVPGSPAEPVPAAPDPPTLDTAEVTGLTVALAWTPGGDGGSAVTGYKLYRGTETGSETLHATLGLVTGHTDTGDPGVTYFYKVTAVNAVGESARSNELTATLPPVLVVAVAPGTDPGEFTDTATLTTTNSSRRSEFYGGAAGSQSQMVTVRITQEGPSARTEIHGIELDLVPQAPGLIGENG